MLSEGQALACRTPGMRSAATGGFYRPTLPLLQERMHQVIAADGKNPVAPSRSRRFDWQDTVRSCSWTTCFGC